jgi:signal transduction histidine kinase/DNA-binding response OmpR family regulator
MAVVFYTWNEKNIIRRGGSGPLYRNLMELPAYVRRGFDPSDITKVPAPGEQWMRFKAPQLRINNSPLPDLPKRKYLSLWGGAAEEFTILFPLEMDDAALSLLVDTTALPGIFLGYIGENWEVYLNGKLVRQEMHLSDSANPHETGQIKSRRNWRDVHFPMEKEILVWGTNILAIRIIGDPAYGVTGLYYTSPYYIDDYKIIERRQQNLLPMFLIGIFGFIGVYYLILFISVRKRREIFNLYYSLFSFLLCAYSVTRHGLVNYLIPNSDVSIRLEYLSLFMMIPLLCLFVEELGWRKVTKVSLAYLGVCGFFSVTQLFFCNQYGDDILRIWGVSVLVYFSYVFFYDIIYCFFWNRRRNKPVNGIQKGDGEESYAFLLNILVGSVLVYACGIFDVLDTLFLHNSSSLFLYSIFVFHIGMAFTLSERFRGMYNRLEQSNVILETTVKERTRELEEQTLIAVQANLAKRQFLATMSHEIRTPLNAVIGLSEIELRNDLELKLLNESSRENIAQIHQSGSFLLEVIGDILDISKIEEGKLELVPVEYDTAAMISSIVNINMVRIASKPINFILDIGSDFPAKLTGDELRVKQILNNLLSNAVKYTNEGTIQLAVNSEQLANENILVRFVVRDTGIGIQSGDMGKLFENYVQLDAKTNRSADGTGLGLSIAKNLTTMMGGSIRAESEYGKGSCFTAEITQSIEKNAPSLGEETADALKNLSYTGGRKDDVIAHSWLPHARVLIVDDKPANLLVARGLFKPYGLIMDTASSGQEAIEKAKAANYDLIFMDHMMPEMDGVEAAKIIMGHGVRAPIIALTANALRGMREFYLEHGFHDHLSKPIDSKMLNEVIVKWIGSRDQGVVSSEQRVVNSDEKTMLPDNNIAHCSLLTAHSLLMEEVATQRLEMLNHYSTAFASGRVIDSDYFKQFTVFIESLQTSTNGEIRAQAASLMTAGREEDAYTIRETLPVFYRTMSNYHLAMNNEQDDAGINDILPRVKKAIIDGDTGTAGTLLAAMGQAKLSPESRGLYFSLYDSLVELRTEKALEAIELWEKLHET